MNKRFTSILLIFAIIIQLAIPIAMIANKMQIDKNFDEKGKEYLFNIRIDGIHKNALFYYFADYDEMRGAGFYIIEDYKDGYSRFVYSKRIPIKKEYVKMSSFIKAEGLYEFGDALQTDDTFIDSYKNGAIKGTARVKIYKGEMKVLEIFVDGIPIEEWYSNSKETNG